MAEKPQPVRVLYCQVCSLPPEYCEFGGSDFEKCKPWLIQNVPDLYPNLLNEVNEKEVGKVADKLQGTGISAAAASNAGAASSEKPQPVRVLYCQVCSLPPEYCEFGGSDFEKCKPWLIQNVPDLYPNLLNEVNEKEVGKVADKLQGTGISSAASSAAAGAASSAGKPEEVKRLPGGKVKKKDKQEVIIEKVVRNKRKSITTVKGLELFGVKLSDASKKLGKKFATGASVVKGPTEKEQIDVQGDISYDVVEFITDTWPDVPERAIFFIEDGKKVPAA